MPSSENLNEAFSGNASRGRTYGRTDRRMDRRDRIYRTPVGSVGGPKIDHIETLNRSFTEAVARGCSVKKVFLDILQNSQENTCARVSFFKKVAGLRPQACNFIKKEALAQLSSCGFCEFSKNNFSYRTPPVAASALNYFKF